MEFIKYCRIWAILLLLPFSKLTAQTVYYPANASTMLRNTALDMAQLLRSALPGSAVTTQAYNSTPVSGIILQYDNTVIDNQACVAVGNGTDKLLLRAAEDNGLIFGVYQYLRDLGFLFYQPGDLWNVVPIISSAFRPVGKTYNGRFKYQSWFISGGHRLWIMDKNNSYNWNGAYIGENGHEWSLFMRRNGMFGKFRFTGHRSDILSGTYLTTIQNNPCYVASNFGSRAAGSSSVPDIFNNAAKDLWADAIEKKYTQAKNNIFSYPVLNKDLLRSFRYNNENVGIEVPDGPRWGIGVDSSNCNNQPYPSASDQAALLANHTSQFIKATYPGKTTQMYAYFTHADIPSVQLDPTVDVQVPTAYQVETSINALFKRWYQKHPNVSEYHYLNIAAWTGETPGFNWNGFDQVAKRMKDNNSQGIIIEASPAKFSSIPLLRTLNNNLTHNSLTNDELLRFCNDMFGQAAATVYDIIKLLGTEQEFLGFKKDNLYRLPMLLTKLRSAHQLAMSENDAVKQRLAELKAYLHYVVLFYEFSFNERLTAGAKKILAGEICVYLAKTNKLRIVNSYYLINTMVSKFSTDAVFVSQFNSQTGTAYQQGNLPLISNSEIEQNFQNDLSKYPDFVSSYKFETNTAIFQKISAGAWKPAEKISVKLGYTAGAQYPVRKKYNFHAERGGKFFIKYNAQFGMPEYGQVNFAVEEMSSATSVVFDSTIRSSQASGVLEINIPSSGTYAVTVSSKYKTGVELEINTGGFAFYKDVAFLGDVVEDFSVKPSSFPGTFYVPQGLSRVYYSLSNSYNAGSGYLSVEEAGRYFVFKDNLGNIVTSKAVPTDSLLFYLEIPGSQSGSFWQFFNSANRFSLCFVNISNYYWFGKPAPCDNADFEIDIINTGGECLVRLTAKNFDGTNEWQVFDKNTLKKYTNLKQLVLPLGTSPYAVISHLSSINCSTQKSLWEEPDFMSALQTCAQGSSLPVEPQEHTVIPFPNPTNGIVQFKRGNNILQGAEVEIFDTRGRRLMMTSGVGFIDMSRFAPAVYIYRLRDQGKQLMGKIQKH